MYYRISSIFLFFICCTSNSHLLAQEEVRVRMINDKEEVTHTGTFNFAVSPGEIVDHSGGLYTIDLTGRKTNRIISVYFTNLKWTKGHKKNSLVVKKSWVGDRTRIFKPLMPCVEIYPGASAPIEIDVLKNGSGTLEITYALKPQNENCSEIKPRTWNSNKLLIKFVVKGLPTPDIEKNSVDNNTNKIAKETKPLSEEEEFWINCKEVEFDKRIPCLNEYLKKYKKGIHLKEAKGTLDYAATEYHKSIEALIANNESEDQIISACQQFLALFPAGTKLYENVLGIQDQAQEVKRIKKSKAVTNVNSDLPPDKEDASKPDNPPTKTKVKPPTPEEIAWKNEDLAWEKAKAENKINCKFYTDYLNNDKNSRYRKEAKRGKATLCEIQTQRHQRADDEYKREFTITNVFDLKVDSIIPSIDSTLIKLEKIKKEYTYNLVVDFPDDQNYVIYVSDPGHPKASRTKSIDIGKLLDAHVREEKDSIFFTFKKGEPPFKIYFAKEEGGVAYEFETEERIVVVEKSYLRDKENFSGTYFIKVSDQILNTPDDPKGKNRLVIEPKIWDWSYAIPVGILLLLLTFYVQKNQRVKKSENKMAEIRAEREAAKEARKQSLNEISKKKIDAEAWEKQSKAERNLVLENTTVISEPSQMTKASGFKIKGLRKSSKKVKHYSEEKELFSLFNDEVFAFELRRHWNDSAIECIYFTYKSISALDQFLVNQNLKPVYEKDGTVPEIGGILMGRPNFCDLDGKYRIIVDEFVPINPESNSVFQLKFSTQSLVKDLGDIQDQFPDYTTVGWFHTHPGHGLFLSKPDLIIQEQYFGELYQFAMEIDSLTEKLDTAFFTFSSDGKINNVKEKIENTNWFSWKEDVESLNIS